MLQVSHITKKYGKVFACDDVTFSLDGYIDSGLRTWSPINNYANFSEATADLFDPEVWIGDTGEDIYVLMLKEINDVSLGIESPTCGTVTETQRNGDKWIWDSQTNPPNVSTPPGAPYALGTTATYLSRYWIEDPMEGEAFIAQPADITALLGQDELIEHQNELVLLKGLTVAAQDDGAAFNYKNAENKTDDLYVRFTKDDMTFNFCVEFYLCGNDTETYKAVEALQVGDVVDIEGFLYWYEGVNTHITAVRPAE